MKHDFVNGETVYLMTGKRLMVGVIIDEDVSNKDYISVKWNGNMGCGSPHYSSLYHTKKEALDIWRENELAKIDKFYKKHIK